MGWCHSHLGLTFLPHLNLSGVSSWACLEVCLCGGPNLAKSAVKMNYHVQCLRTWLTFQQDLGVLHKAPKGGQAPLSQSMIYVDCLGMGTSYSPWSYFSVISQAPYLPGSHTAAVHDVTDNSASRDPGSLCFLIGERVTLL